MSNPPAERLLSLLTISAVINYLDCQSLAVLLPLLREDLHLITSQYSNITAAFLLAYSLGFCLARGLWLSLAPVLATRRS